MPPFGRRNSTDPRSQGEIVCDHGRSGSASPIGASEGLAVEASARPGTELITPSSGSPATRAVLQLPHPSILCASVEARRLSFRVSPTGAQVAKEARSLTEMWFSCSRKLRSDAKARCRSRLAGKIDRNDDPISLNAIARLAAALDDERAAPRQPILAEPARELDEGTRIFRPDHHVDAGVFVLADLDPLAAMRHGVDAEDLAAQRRPQETFLARILDVDPREGAA